MHGLSAAGDAGAGRLLPLLLDSSTPPAVLGAAAAALGEAALNPTVEMVLAYQTAMSRLRREILAEEIAPEIQLAPEAATALERHRGTAFCSAPFREQYTQPRWQALAAAAVGLWHLAQRAVAVGDAGVCAAAVDAAVPFVATGTELGPQCRQNATGALLTLSSASADLLPSSTRERLTLALAGLAEDDDRYVRAAALHALVRDVAEPAAPRARAIHEVFSSLVEQRWCPISGLAGLSQGASF